MMPSCTSFLASSSVILDLNSDSKTAIAASEPEPMVTYGRLSVEPCGYTVYSDGPLQSMPPSTSAALTLPWYRKSMRFSIVHAVTTRGCLPVAMRCISSCDEMSIVVFSVSAEVPAPQHQMLSAM